MKASRAIDLVMKQARTTLRELVANEPSDSYAIFGPLAHESVAGIIREIKANAAGGTVAVRERLAQSVIELIGNAIDHGADASGKFAYKSRHETWRVPISVSIGDDELGFYVKLANLTSYAHASNMVHRISMLAEMEADVLEARFRERYKIGEDDAGLLGLLMVARMTEVNADGKRLLSANANRAGSEFAALEIKAYVQSGK